MDFNETMNGKQKMATIVIEYITVVISTIGIVLNILAYLVFMQKKFAEIGFVKYFKIKLITDFLILLHAYRDFAEFVLGLNMDNIPSVFLCKTVEYSLFVVGSISAWMFGMISFDRFVSIVFLNKYSIMKRK